jgi:hypothetical protein
MFTERVGWIIGRGDWFTVHMSKASHDFFHIMGVGDGYPPGPLEGKKASQKALGPLFRKAIPSWARGGVFNRTDQHKDGST